MNPGPVGSGDLRFSGAPGLGESCYYAERPGQEPVRRPAVVAAGFMSQGLARSGAAANPRRGPEMGYVRKIGRTRGFGQRSTERHARVETLETPSPAQGRRRHRHKADQRRQLVAQHVAIAVAGLPLFLSRRPHG
jgi:hypothetical protein